MGQIGVLPALILVWLSLDKELTAAQDPRRIGCYTDKWTRALQHWGPDQGDVEPCIKYCISEGYLFAGVQNSNQCFCGNGNYDRYGESDGCVYRCSGNSKVTCGGNWALEVFKAECVSGLWKQNPPCSVECGQCLENKCNMKTGECEPPQCKKGWHPPNCTECEPGYFGDQCRSECHCDDGVPCDSTSGHCPGGKCAPEWKGLNCSTSTH